MPVTTKAEAEALTVPELKSELESRGLGTEGIKAVLLETLLTHMDNAANGEPYVPPSEEPKKDEEEAAPAEETAVAPETTEEPAKKAEADGKETADPVPGVAPVGDEVVTRSMAPAADIAVTRSADEVSGGTEEPGSAKKAKTDTPEETTKGVEAETPAAEPAAATAE